MPKIVEVIESCRPAEKAEWFSSDVERLTAVLSDILRCVACDGTGRSSRGNECVPCDGTGVKQCRE